MRLDDGTIYLDCNATVPLRPEAREALLEAERMAFANPSSPYGPGRKAKEFLEAARSRLLERLSFCSDLVFTGSATEANHLAILSAASDPSIERVVLSSIEHPSCYEPCMALKETGRDVVTVGVDARGVVRVDELKEALKGRRCFVSVMSAHNETGVLQPVAEIAEACSSAGAVLHTDAVQAFRKVDPPWGSSFRGTVALAAHKIGGPKGIGALARCGDLELRPILRGGGQEKGLRSSTEAVPLAASFASAAMASGPSSYRVAEEARDFMESVLGEELSVTVHGAGAPRLPNTSFFSVEGKDGRRLQAALAERGIFVGTGSACHGVGGGLPAVLGEMGACGSSYPLRVSFSPFSRKADAEAFIGALIKIAGVV